jgi:hypothetical protein
VTETLDGNFWSTSWSGNASDHYRRLRDAARHWLAVETEDQVIQFLNRDLDRLDRAIRGAELDEERSL